MKIGDEGIEIFERLAQGGKLTPWEEQCMIGAIKMGAFNDTKKVVQLLRSNSDFFRNRIGDQMENFVTYIKQWRFYEAYTCFGDAIVSEWKGADINAQANRIDNAANQAINANLPPKPPTPPEIPYVGIGAIEGLQTALSAVK